MAPHQQMHRVLKLRVHVPGQLLTDCQSPY